MHWFNEDEKIAYPHAEQIVLEARRKLGEAERDGKLPKEKAPAGLPVSEIIRHCNRAVPATTDDVSFIERYANWLSLWTYHAMPDGWVRDKALDIALDEFMARSTKRYGSHKGFSDLQFSGIMLRALGIRIAPDVPPNLSLGRSVALDCLVNRTGHVSCRLAKSHRLRVSPDRNCPKQARKLRMPSQQWWPPARDGKTRQAENENKGSGHRRRCLCWRTFSS